MATALCLTTLGAEAAQQSSAAPAATPQASAQQAPGMAQGPESVHIMVGHSLLIHTGSRIKRVLTGNPAVIESVPTSPRELVITAKETGGSSLMVWDETGQNRTLDVYADLDITPLRNTLDESFPNSSVEVQSQGGKVSLVGTVSSPAVADQILKMASNYSKDVVNGLQVAAPPRQKQVMLKVRFAEADRGKLTQFGINLFSTGATNTIGTTSTQQFGPLAIQQQSTAGSTTPPNTPQQFTLSNLLNVFLFRPDIGLGAIIADLQTKNVLQILAEPNLMALNGEAAHFLAGGEFPVPVAQGLQEVTIEWKRFGVSIEFTPTVLDAHRINIKVRPEVSELSATGSVTLDGITVPALAVRRADTTVELASGQSFAIAGLFQNNVQNQIQQMPWLGDVPVLGALFRSASFQRNESELVIIVTPYVVQPASGPGELHLPTEGIVFASDLEQLLLGRLTTPQGTVQTPEPASADRPHLSGAAGLILE